MGKRAPTTGGGTCSGSALVAATFQTNGAWCSKPGANRAGWGADGHGTVGATGGPIPTTGQRTIRNTAR